jgi:hypothetical protein
MPKFDHAMLSEHDAMAYAYEFFGWGRTETARPDLPIAVAYCGDLLPRLIAVTYCGDLLPRLIAAA